MLRRFRGNEYFLIGAAIFAVPIGFALLATFDVARDAGAALAGGESGALDGLEVMLAAGWVLTAGFHLFVGLGEGGDVDEEAGMLTVRPPKDVAGGYLAFWGTYFGVYVLVPVVAGFVGLAVGVGSPLPIVGGLLATVVIAASAIGVGYPIGLALKGVLRRTDVLHRLKPVLAVGIGIAYFYVMFSGRWLELVEAAEPVLTDPPLGWIGDVALLTTPGADVSVAGAGGALALTAASVVLGTLATVRAAEYTWSADRVHDDLDQGSDGRGGDDAGATANTPAAIARPLDALCRRPQTRGVAEVTMLRAYRRPMLMVYSLWPLLLAIPMVDQLVSGGTLPWYAPWFAVLVGGYVAGESIPLNALGNQGATLPTLLTSRADGRAVVHGHVVAIAVPVVPFAAALAAGAGALAGRPPFELAVLAVAAGGAVVAGAVLAIGCGALFPRFDTVSVGDSTEISIPSKRAFGAFSLSVSLTTTGLAFAVDETARIVGSVVLTEYAPLVEPSPEQLHALGLALVALVAVAVPAAYVVAIRRIDGFRLD